MLRVNSTTKDENRRGAKSRRLFGGRDERLFVGLPGLARSINVTYY